MAGLKRITAFIQSIEYNTNKKNIELDRFVFVRILKDIKIIKNVCLVIWILYTLFTYGWLLINAFKSKSMRLQKNQIMLNLEKYKDNNNKQINIMKS